MKKTILFISIICIIILLITPSSFRNDHVTFCDLLMGLILVVNLFIKGRSITQVGFLCAFSVLLYCVTSVSSDIEEEVYFSRLSQIFGFRDPNFLLSKTTESINELCVLIAILSIGVSIFITFKTFGQRKKMNIK